jgi:hypothetical protein
MRRQVKHSGHNQPSGQSGSSSQVRPDLCQSRPEEDIAVAFSGNNQIEIQDQAVSDDVHEYLENVTSKAQKLKDIKPDLNATIVHS